MNRPDWQDAPSWANWVAKDIDGTWWWYENKPILSSKGYWKTEGPIRECYVHENIESTLEERPK